TPAYTPSRVCVKGRGGEPSVELLSLVFPRFEGGNQLRLDALSEDARRAMYHRSKVTARNMAQEIHPFSLAGFSGIGTPATIRMAITTPIRDSPAISPEAKRTPASLRSRLSPSSLVKKSISQRTAPPMMIGVLTWTG